MPSDGPAGTRLAVSHRRIQAHHSLPPWQVVSLLLLYLKGVSFSEHMNRTVNPEMAKVFKLSCWLFF